MPGYEQRPNRGKACFPWLSGPSTRSTGGRRSTPLTRASNCTDAKQNVKAAFVNHSGVGSTKCYSKANVKQPILALRPGTGTPYQIKYAGCFQLRQILLRGSAAEQERAAHRAVHPDRSQEPGAAAEQL